MSQPILTVGPRVLPDDGLVKVWIDTGSGPGYVRPVSPGRLSLAAIDDGLSAHAIYQLRPLRDTDHPAGPEPAGPGEGEPA